jgi:molybdopterin molybdotransferase
VRVPWVDARRLAHATGRPLPPVDLPLADAGGGTLAAPLRAGSPLPGFDCAAMDGYAVGDVAGPWTIAGRAIAGPAGTPDPLTPGLAVEIATGAVVPPGTVAVLPYESATRDGDRVHGVAVPGRHVRSVGEDVPLGTDLVPAGSPVGPAVLGLAAEVGLDTLAVRPRPAVALLVTGDELVVAGGSAGGLVRDALGPALPGWVGGLGGRPLPAVRVPDSDPADVAKAVASADGDVVLTSGGVGGGPKDLIVPALRLLGAELVVHRVDCRPGGPARLAVLPDGRPVMALPGYPYAALIGVLTLLGPLLTALSGRALPDLPTAHLVGGPSGLGGPPEPGGASGLPGRRDPSGPAGLGPLPTRVLPVRWCGDGSVAAVGLDRPGSLWGAALAGAFAVIPPGWAGEPVPLLAPPG